MNSQDYEKLELIVVSAINHMSGNQLTLDALSREVFSFALLLAKSSYQKLDDALRDPED